MMSEKFIVSQLSTSRTLSLMIIIILTTNTDISRCSKITNFHSMRRLNGACQQVIHYCMAIYIHFCTVFSGMNKFRRSSVVLMTTQKLLLSKSHWSKVVTISGLAVYKMLRKKLHHLKIIN